MPPCLCCVMNKLTLLTLVMTLISLALVTRAYLLKKQFYLVCLYLVNSNAYTTQILSITLIFYLVSVGRLIVHVLFGTLRVIEVEGWFTASEAFLFLSLFREDLDSRSLFLFILYFFCECLKWIVQHRIDFMEQTPELPPRFHYSVVSALSLLLTFTFLMIDSAVDSYFNKGPAVMIMFGLHFFIISISTLFLVVKYAFNVYESRLSTSFENKTLYLLYVEIAADFLKIIAFTCFVIVIINLYGLPLHILRDFYITVKSFFTKCRDLIRYHQAVANMQTRYAEATPEELNQTDRICIICREEMQEARKLPCGHLFHFRCLRTWLERQQLCPTCRRSVLVELNNAGPRPIPPAVEQQHQIPVQRVRDLSDDNIKPVNQHQHQYTLVPAISDVHLMTDQDLNHLTERELERLEGKLKENIMTRIEFLKQMQKDISNLTIRMEQFMQLDNQQAEGSSRTE